MKEYLSKVGGRYTYKTDWENLQELALSVSEVFKGCNNFVISGCELTGSAGNYTIAPGFIWMNNKVRKFDGKTGLDLAITSYLVESTTTISVKYAGGGVKDGVYDYKVIWSQTSPVTSLSKITIPADGTLPKINDEFFGKYCILSSTKSSQQTINKPLYLSDKLNVINSINVGGSTTTPTISSSRTTTLGVPARIDQSIGSTGIGSITNYYNSNKIGEMIFDPLQKKFKISIDGTDQITVSKGSVVLHSVTSDGSITNSTVSIDLDAINVVAGDTDVVELKMNQKGFNSGTTRFRNLGIYDGKGSKLFGVDGLSKSITSYGRIYQKDNNDNAINIASSVKTKDDISFKKSINWLDKNNINMLKIGYIGDTDNNVTISNESIGDIVVSPKQYFKSLKPIMESGSILSDKYADKVSTNASIANKVDKIAGKALSANDFTNELKSKLESIAGGTVTPGSEGYITGDQMNTAINTTILKENNLNDLTDVIVARSNLNVYSETESNNLFVSKSKNLSDINVSLARTNLNVYSKDESNLRTFSKEANLSDLPDITEARDNIDVYSTSEIDNAFVKKTNNLSDVDAALARANLSVYPKSELFVKSDLYTKSEVFTKDESNNNFEATIEDTGWLDCQNPDNVGSFNIKARKYGKIVNIIGSAAPAGNGKTWFRLPVSISAPQFATGAVVNSQAANADINRGMSIYCLGGSKDFLVREEHHAQSTIYVNLTYLV